MTDTRYLGGYGEIMRDLWLALFLFNEVKRYPRVIAI